MDTTEDREEMGCLACLVVLVHRVHQCLRSLLHRLFLQGPALCLSLPQITGLLRCFYTVAGTQSFGA